MPPHQPSPFARRSRILRLLAFLAASFVSFLAFYSEYVTITRRLGHPCRPDARQGSGFESPRRGGGVTTSQRAHAVAKLLVSTGGTRCQVSRPRSPRDQHRASSACKLTPTARARVPPAFYTSSPSSPCFCQAPRRSDGRFFGARKGTPTAPGCPGPCSPY